MELDMFCSLFHAICHLRRGLKFRSPHFSEWKMKKFVCCMAVRQRKHETSWVEMVKMLPKKSDIAAKDESGCEMNSTTPIYSKISHNFFSLVGLVCYVCRAKSESVKSLNITTLTQFISIITPDSSRTICEFKVNRISVRRYCCAVKNFFSPDWGESFSRNLPHFPDTLAQHPLRHSTETSSNFFFFPVKLGTLVEEHPLWSGSKVILNNSKNSIFHSPQQIPFELTPSRRHRCRWCAEQQNKKEIYRVNEVW